MCKRCHHVKVVSVSKRIKSLSVAHGFHDGQVSVASANRDGGGSVELNYVTIALCRPISLGVQVDLETIAALGPRFGPRPDRNLCSLWDVTRVLSDCGRHKKNSARKRFVGVGKIDEKRRADGVLNSTSDDIKQKLKWRNMMFHVLLSFFGPRVKSFQCNT